MALKSLDEEKDAKYKEKYECCFLFLILSLFPTVTKLFFLPDFIHYSASKLQFLAF